MSKGLNDLLYLPAGRSEWNVTLAAIAYSMRRQHGNADLNVWAAMHGRPASARYAELGARALVLWHGTSAHRAEKIREVGLFPKKGIWATAEPKLAHGFTRSRSTEYAAGSAMIVLLLDREEIPVAFEMAGEPDTLRFRSPLGPEFIEYILWDDRIDFVGAHRSRQPRAWGKGRFKKVSGRWVPRSQPPVRFDGERTYRDLHQWLELSVRRIVETVEGASAMEIFSSLYATIDPTDALPHEAVLDAIDRVCSPIRSSRGDATRFALAGEEVRRRRPGRGCRGG